MLKVGRLRSGCQPGWLMALFQGADFLYPHLAQETWGLSGVPPKLCLTFLSLLLVCCLLDLLIFMAMLCCAVSLQLCPTLCNPMDCSPPGSSVHGDSLGKNTGVGCHALLQGIVPGSLRSPALAGGFFTTSATWEGPVNYEFLRNTSHLTHLTYHRAKDKILHTLENDHWMK